MSRVSLQIALAALASVTAGFLLMQMHFASQAAKETAHAAGETPPAPGLSSSEERELTREVLKARRENAEEPAEVKPMATDRKVVAREPEPAPRSAAAPRRDSVARTHTDVAGLPAPPPAQTQAAQPAGSPIALNPVAVTAAAPAPQMEPERRGVVGTVFSAVSFVAGTAANVTGDTINWLIDLPGKAVSAGGKIISREPQAPSRGDAREQPAS